MKFKNFKNFFFSLSMYQKNNLMIIEHIQKFSKLGNSILRSDPVNAENSLDLLSKIPRQFKFNVNEKSYYINKDVAQQLCSKVLKAQQNNNNNGEILSFDINIKDPDNKMQLFIDICNGQIASVNLKKYKEFFFSLSQILGFFLPSCFTISNQYLDRKNTKTIQLALSPSSVAHFLKSVSDNFEITTKKGKYHFPYTLAPLSNFLSNLLTQDPNIRTYEYFYDDNNSEFKIIESFLSGHKINIIPQNIDYVTQFAHDLDIPILLDIINNFSKEFEYSQQILDAEFDQNSDLTDLQDLLFNLTDENLVSSINKIENSAWISSFELTKELISNIAVVASYRHSHLYNLVKICKHFSEKDSRFLEFLTNFVLKISNDSILLCQFVYFLSKENLIPIKNILKFITFQYTEINNTKTYYSMLILFFLPELLTDYPYIFDLISPKLKDFYFLKINNPATYDFSEYYESREKMQNLDPMAISISLDDPDSLQLQVVQKSFNVKRFLTQCQFDNIEKLTLVNYAAIHGSVNCFKYLVLNGADISQSTFINAVIGGNTEIVRIIEQKLSSEPSSEFQKDNNNNNNNNFNFPFQPQNQMIFQKNKSRSFSIITDFPGRAFKGIQVLRPGFENVENDNNDMINNPYHYSQIKKYRKNIINTKTSGLGTPIMTSKIKTSYKDYLLYAACSYHRDGIFEWLISLASDQSDTTEYLRYCFHATTETNNVNALALIIDNGVSLNSPQNYLANILLTTAAFYGYSDIFRVILNSTGRDAIYDPCTGRATTLIAASQFGSLKIIDMINKSGANIAIEDIKIAIHESIDQHNFDVFYKLVEIYNFDIENDFPYLLFIAATSGSTEILEFLFTNFPNKFDYIINHQNDEPNINIDGICSIAARNDQYESIQMIYNFLDERQSQLENIPIVNRPKKVKFTQTLSEAARIGSIQICNFLLSKGVTLEPECIKPTIAELSSKGMTDIIKLLFASFTNTMKNQLAEKFIITAIDSHKIDIALLFVELSNVNGNALIHASRNGLYTVVDEMLRKNTSPDFLNTNTREGTALCEAARTNNIEIVRLLISKPGIDVHIYNSSHDTALTIAARKRNFEIIKLLAPFCTEKQYKWEMNAAFCIYYSNTTNINENGTIPINQYDDYLTLSDKNKGLMPRFNIQASYDNFDISPTVFFLEFEGIDINYCYQGTTILGEAIETGCLPLIEILLSRPEFESSIYTGLNLSALSMATTVCDAQTITLILNKLIQINNKYNDKSTQKQIKSLFNEIEFYNIFISSCSNGRLDLVKFFLSDESPFKINEQMILQSLSIMISSSNEKSKDIITLLMNLDFDINKKVSPRNQSLLTISALSGAISTMEQIIVHNRFAPDKQEVKLALFNIISSTNAVLINSLLNFLDNDINQINQNGESLLIVAVSLSSFNNVSLIINHVSFNPIRSMAKKAFFLSLIKSPNIAALFVGSNFIDINEPYQEDFSLIHGNILKLKDTLNEFDYPNSGSTSIIGWTPLMIAATLNDIADLIMNAPNIDINKKGSDGSAPIFVAIQYKSCLVDSLLRNPQLDLNIQDSKGRTPLIFASQLFEFSVAIKILKTQHDSEVDLDIKDNSGLTALDYLEAQKVFSNTQIIPKTKDELVEHLQKFAAKEGLPGLGYD